MAAKSRVYIVDDDEAIRDSLQLLLELHGIPAYAYRSCSEFLADFRPGGSACLLLDRDLPEMGGIEFLTAFGRRLSGLPVLMMSGQWDERTRALAAEAGALALLEKPIDSDLMIAAIRATGGGHLGPEQSASGRDDQQVA